MISRSFVLLNRKSVLLVPKKFANCFKINFSMDIGDMRVPYLTKASVLLEEHIDLKEPIYMFSKWFEQVQNCREIIEPNAMCLATATKEGAPSARFVLCKHFGKDGFKFFTHYTSRKGQELEENPKASLVFYWPPFNRSVRIEGEVQKLPLSEADDYFRSRPYRSKIGGLCSNQSKPIEARRILEERAEELTKKYEEDNVPRPEFWGGYILVPNCIEFWQGQTDRIHDRIRFRKPALGEEPDGVLSHEGEDGWIYERLAP